VTCDPGVDLGIFLIVAGVALLVIGLWVSR
jgi:hypothetical protein